MAKTKKESKIESSKISMSYIILIILSSYAVYLSFKCNNGFDLGGFLSALIFPMLYIPYKLAIMPKQCGLPSFK